MNKSDGKCLTLIINAAILTFLRNDGFANGANQAVPAVFAGESSVEILRDAVAVVA